MKGISGISVSFGEGAGVYLVGGFANKYECVVVSQDGSDLDD